MALKSGIGTHLYLELQTNLSSPNHEEKLLRAIRRIERQPKICFLTSTAAVLYPHEMVWQLSSQYEYFHFINYLKHWIIKWLILGFKRTRLHEVTETSQWVYGGKNLPSYPLENVNAAENSEQKSRWLIEYNHCVWSSDARERSWGIGKQCCVQQIEQHVHRLLCSHSFLL